MDLIKLKEYVDSTNLPSFRYKQILKNYISARYSSFSEMTDLPLDLRNKLEENFSLYSLKVDQVFSESTSKKAILKSADGHQIETVLMDYGQWITACVSSQIGCPLNCSFCATGKMGFKRNLTDQEIVDQIIFWNQQLYPKYIGRVVFMGMGEPFLNWDNLISSLEIIRSKDGLNIGSRKISISTAGIIDKIVKFATMSTQINLAISLHALNQKTREKIMPIAKEYPINDLKEACNFYTNRTNRQLFFEYTLMKDVNDKPEDAKELVKFIKSNHLYYLNLIPLNEVEGGMLASSQRDFDNFVHILNESRIYFSVRKSFGGKFSGACGQLAGNP